METSYAHKTFEDRNAVKRYLQKRRLTDALRLAEPVKNPGMIVDFGAGNGELCKHLRRLYPSAGIVCFEPHPGLLRQARENVGPNRGVRFVSDAFALPDGMADLVFCLEVFEHLPARESQESLLRIETLLAPAARAVIGVPVETALPALYKGVFRMLRRFGDFDTSPARVLAAVMGRPPRNRPEVELMPGSRYHLHHLGFDHRRFEALLSSRFSVVDRSHSPLGPLGAWINSEVSYLVTPKEKAIDAAGAD